MRPIARTNLLLLTVVLYALLASAAGADAVPHPPFGPVYHGPHCTAPKLIGKTLPEVRQTFRDFHTWCRLGEIAGQRHGTVVVRQSPKPGAIRPWHTEVNITLR